jgi:hypothetical protein
MMLETSHLEKGNFLLNYNIFNSNPTALRMEGQMLIQ